MTERSVYSEEEGKRLRLIAAAAMGACAVALLESGKHGVAGRPMPAHSNLPAISAVELLAGSSSERQFRRYFRLPKTVVSSIIDGLSELVPKRPRQRKDTLGTTEVVLIALLRLGTRGEEVSLTAQTKRCPASIHRCVILFVREVVEKYNHLIRLPTTRGALLQTIQQMEEERGVPGCFGELDGKHWVQSCVTTPEFNV